jgi:hypothetical protein
LTSSASYCRGILANAEDDDDQIEDLNHVITRPGDLVTCDMPVRRTIGEQYHVSLPDFEQLAATHDSNISENMAMHCAISLLAILPNALETEYSEIISLKVRVQSNQPRVGLR